MCTSVNTTCTSDLVSSTVIISGRSLDHLEPGILQHISRECSDYRLILDHKDEHGLLRRRVSHLSARSMQACWSWNRKLERRASPAAEVCGPTQLLGEI